MAAGPIERRQQNERRTAQHRAPEFAGVVHPGGGAWTFRDKRQVPHERQVPQPPSFVRTGFPNDEDAAAARQFSNRRPKLRPDLLIHDEPLLRHRLAAGHARSYSASR